MRASRLLLGVAVLTGFGVTGCASMSQGGTQTVNVVVQGSSVANCTFANDTVHQQGRFPGPLTIERSRNDVQADCTGDDNRHVTFVVPSTITKAGALSGATNSMLPATSYDAATGGLYAYPDPVTVDFREISETSAVTSDAMAPADAAAIETSAPFHAATSMKMQPVVETKTTTTTKTTSTKTLTTPVSSKSRMQPVASPEDKMGADPAKVKAAAKAKVEAAKKAKEAAANAAAEKKRAAAEAAEAKKAAAEAARQAAEQPAVAPAATPAATTVDTTTTTTTTTAPATVAPVPSTDTPPADVIAAPSSATTTTTTTPAVTAPAPATEGNSDVDKYLKGQ